MTAQVDAHRDVSSRLADAGGSIDAIETNVQQTVQVGR